MPGAEVSIPLSLDLLRPWVVEQVGELQALSIDARTPLSGGVASPVVDRVDLRAETLDGAIRCVSVVAKRTDESEVRALQLMASLGEIVVPTLLDHGCDASGRWIVVPFYRGEVAGLIEQPPTEIYPAMARIHATFAERASELPACFQRVDSQFCATALGEFAPSMIADARRELGMLPVFDHAEDMVCRVAADAAFNNAVDRFTPTLLHGDLYGMNVIKPSAGQPAPVVIDWNCARVGPAMFDVAMGVPFGSAGYCAYVEGWTQATGSAPDAREFELEYVWASALINAMFASVVAARGSTTAAGSMVDQAESALIRFHELLASPGTPDN